MVVTWIHSTDPSVSPWVFTYNQKQTYMPDAALHSVGRRPPFRSEGSERYGSLHGTRSRGPGAGRFSVRVPRSAHPSMRRPCVGTRGPAHARHRPRRLVLASCFVFAARECLAGAARGPTRRPRRPRRRRRFGSRSRTSSGRGSARRCCTRWRRRPWAPPGGAAGPCPPRAGPRRRRPGARGLGSGGSSVKTVGLLFVRGLAWRLTTGSKTRGDQ